MPGAYDALAPVAKSLGPLWGGDDELRLVLLGSFVGAFFVSIAFLLIWVLVLAPAIPAHKDRSPTDKIFLANSFVSSWIAMTAPVQQGMSGKAEMAFMMPAEFSLEDLPEPDDERVGFEVAPAYTAAVIRFSGWASADKADEHWQRLRQFLIAEQIDITGEPTLNQYNPPWTLPFLRRNEIIVPVALTEASPSGTAGGR